MRRAVKIGLSLLVAAAILISLGIAVRTRRYACFGPLAAATADIVAQVDAAGASLPPGGQTTIRIPAVAADELVVLPCYCSAEEIDARLAHHSQGFREALLAASQDDGRGAALVWAHGDDVLAICHAQFRVAMNLKLKVVNLRGVTGATIAKENSSPNRFLSISFE